MHCWVYLPWEMPTWRPDDLRGHGTDDDDDDDGDGNDDDEDKSKTKASTPNL